MPDIDRLDHQAAQNHHQVIVALDPVIRVFHRIVGVLVMMQMQGAETGIGRQQDIAADLADGFLDEAPFAVAAHDIVVHRFMQGGEDAVDQHGVDRHRRPIGQMAGQGERIDGGDTGQHAEEPGDRTPGELARKRLRHQPSLRLEGAVLGQGFAVAALALRAVAFLALGDAGQNLRFGFRRQKRNDFPAGSDFGAAGIGHALTPSPAGGTGGLPSQGRRSWLTFA